MTLKKHIPNIITLLNLCCGCIAIVMTAELQFEMAFYFVCLGIFFDFFDGFFARQFGVAGPLGVQLDSLADMVTSGVAPGFVMFCMLSINDFSTSNYFPYLAFIITLGACYRLAKFNIDTRQSDSFIGLPTPANALLIMSLPLIIKYNSINFIIDLLANKWFLLVIIVFSAFIMNAEIPLFSLKIKDFSFQKYKVQIGFLLISVLLILTLQFLAIPLIIISYVLLSLINTLLTKK